MGDARLATELAIAAATEHRALNVFIHLDPEGARAQALAAPQGPLHGWTCSVKDNLDVAGWPTTGGTPGLAGWHPAGTATVVRGFSTPAACCSARTTCMSSRRASPATI